MHFANGYNIGTDESVKEYRIYLLMTDYPDRVSRFLKKAGMWRYSHVSVSTSMVESDFYSFVGKKGLRIEKPALHPTFRGKPVNCAFYSIPVSEEVCRAVTERIMRHLAIAHTYRYSYAELVLIYFGIHLKFKNRYTCTGFVSELLRESGGFGDKKYKRLLNPNHFMKKFSEHLVFTGTLEAMLKSFAEKRRDKI